MSTRIKNFYNNDPEREWNRLSQDSYHQIEFEISKRFIKRYLKKGFKVADIGGGPGRYALWLLEQGCDVSLVDPAQGLLEKARSQFAEKTYSSKLLETLEASATNLSQLSEDSFDLTIAFGPFYHLTSAIDRFQAMNELLRITKPDGLIFVATINQLCPIRDMLFGNTEDFVNELKNNYSELSRMISEGTYFNHSENPEAFTDAYFAPTTEIPKLFTDVGIKFEESFSCEGIASFLDKKTEIVHQDQAAWERLLDLIESTATEKSILGSGEHSVYIGRKSLKNEV